MECPVCRKEIAPGTSFCPHCGASVAGASGFQPVNEGYVPPPPGGGYPPPPAGYPPIGSPVAGISNNMAAALAYVTIIPAIVFLVLEPYNKVPLVRFHSFQSIALFVAAFICHFVVSFLQIGLHFIPLSFFLFGTVQVLISIGFFVIWLITILKASRGEYYKLPVLGDFADAQARK